MASRWIEGNDTEYVLSGMICSGRKWNDELAIPFHIRFGSGNFSRAQKTALEQIKAFVRRHMKRSGVKKFLTDGATLVDCSNAKNKVVIKPYCRNNSLLFKKQFHDVFQPLS